MEDINYQRTRNKEQRAQVKRPVRTKSRERGPRKRRKQDLLDGVAWLRDEGGHGFVTKGSMAL
jgi:hypothetical protein